jgi:hypothetical protein
MYWVRGHGDRQPGLERSLASAGLVRAGSVVSMVADLSSAIVPVPFGLAVERVSGPTAMAAWTEFLGVCAGVPSHLRGVVSRLYAPAAGGAADIRLLVGSRDGRPAAASVLRTEGGIASLWFVGGLPAGRGRGARSGMVLAGMAAARAHGCTHAVLASLPATAGAYERLGFRRHGRFEVYEGDFRRP